MTLFQIDELTTLEEWVSQTKTGIKKPEVMILRKLDPLVLAYKTAIALQPAINNFKPLVPTCMDIGKLVLQNIENLEDSERDLSITRFKVGWHLLDVLIKNKMISLQRGQGARDVYIIKPKNKEGMEFLSKLFEQVNISPLDGVHINTRPLDKQPEPFTEYNHTVLGPMVRNINPIAQELFTFDECPDVFNAINKHMSTAYQVNGDVLEILEEIKEDDALFTLSTMDVTKEQKDGIQREMDSTLKIATGWVGKPFWEALFYDNRGRLYSSAVYFSHQGSKLSKSLFLLDEKKPITEKGWDWLLVHATNCFGEDKLTIEERIQYANEHLLEWMVWLEDPINTKFEEVDEETGEITEYRPWTKADSPFEFLAAILEIKKARAYEGGKFNYPSGLVVAFDATCSGLQVLSAMSRDKFSGQMCNLTASDEIGDYYKTIADELWKQFEYTPEEEEVYNAIAPELTRLNKIVENTKGKARKEAIENSKAFQEENKEAIKIATRVFWGRDEIKAKRRKLVKRPCMTFFYSCRERTMAKQLLKDFKTDTLYSGIHPVYCYSLAYKLYQICETKMNKPTALMNLFIEMGLSDYRKGYKHTLDGVPRPDKSIIDNISPKNEDGKFIAETRARLRDVPGLAASGEKGVGINEDYVEGGLDFTLTAPVTKFPLVQNYRDNLKERVKIWYNNKWLYVTVSIGKGQKLNYKKIQNATSPNVVHMLDSQIIAKVLLDTDYTVSCIHDSFGASACDAGKLYKDVRVAFVEIFNEDVLTGLTEQKGIENKIEYGNLDINDVYRDDDDFNQYTFS